MTHHTKWAVRGFWSRRIEPLSGGEQPGYPEEGHCPRKENEETNRLNIDQQLAVREELE